MAFEPPPASSLQFVQTWTTKWGPLCPRLLGKGYVIFSRWAGYQHSHPLQSYVAVLPRLNSSWMQLRQWGFSSSTGSPLTGQRLWSRGDRLRLLELGSDHPHPISFKGQRFHSGKGEARRPETTDPIHRVAHTVTKHWAYTQLFQFQAQGAEQEVPRDIVCIHMDTVISTLIKWTSPWNLFHRNQREL